MAAVIVLNWMPYYYELNRQQTQRLEGELPARRKQLLQEQVDRTADYIEHMRSESEKRHKVQIKARAQDACEIALNIYRENKNRENHHTLVESASLKTAISLPVVMRGPL